MSEQNVQRVRQGFHALGVGGVEALLPFLANDVVMHPFVEWPDDPVYRGHDGARKLITAWTDNFEDWGIDVREIRAAGTRVVALTEMTGEIKGSRVPIRQPLGVVFSDIHENTAGEVRFFLTWPEAFKAVGLEEYAVLQENVETARNAMERFIATVNVAHGDESLLAPMLAPGFRIDNIVTAVTDKTYLGAAGCIEWYDDTADAFAEGVRCEIEAIIADRDDFVVARLAFVGTGARSGAPLRMPWIGVTWLQDGKLARCAGYANRHEALKAVGLEE
jgi:ketosteroid isomerase-like protein